MASIFPPPVLDLPEADIPLPGLKAWLSRGAGHQIVFMEFTETVEIAPHTHPAAQWSIVLEGHAELEIEGVSRVYRKGDRIFVPAGAKHSARNHAGYADVTFFGQRDRYRTK